MTRTVSLFHPFTARAIGWADERSLPYFHSRPHVLALQQLAQGGLRPRVEYLTDSYAPRRTTVGDVEWRFWPRSMRRRSSRKSFRRERSAQALMAATLVPADVTIINTSGHGGRLPRQLASVLSRRGRPYVAMIGGFHVTLDGANLAYLTMARSVVAHTNELATRLVRAGLPRGSVHVLPLGVDTTRFAPAPAVQNAPLRILYVGKVARLKGVDLLIRAMASARSAHQSLQLRIVGPESDPAYMSELHQLTRTLGVSGAVEFTGPMAHDQLPAEYGQSRLLVLPSEREGFGMVLVEAMACGVPVIALRGAGGPDEIIEDGVTGRLTTQEELAAVLVELLSEPSCWQEMSAAARAAAEERFSLEVTTSAIRHVVAAASR